MTTTKGVVVLISTFVRTSRMEGGIILLSRDSISFRNSSSRSTSLSIVGIIVPSCLVSTNVLLLLLLLLPTRVGQLFDTVRVVVVFCTAAFTKNIGN